VFKPYYTLSKKSCHENGGWVSLSMPVVYEPIWSGKAKRTYNGIIANNIVRLQYILPSRELGIIQTPTWRKWTDHPPWEVPLFVWPDFSCELVDDLHTKNTWFPRMSSLFSYVSLQSVAISRLDVAFMDPFDIQMHVSRYHAIDTKHVYILVNFEGGLSISALRNKAFFTKKKRRWANPLENDLFLIFLPNCMDSLCSNVTIWSCP
jgi:hypothetical protein